MLLLFAEDAFAQIVPGGSPRSRGFGGFSEAFGEDPLATFDNPAILGRNKDFSQQIEFAAGFAPVPNLADSEWKIGYRNFEDIWFRFAYIPNQEADALHWSFWAGSTSIVLSYRGNLRTEDAITIIESSVGFTEAGASLGISISDEMSIGIGLGLCFAFVRIQGEDAFTGTEKNFNDFGFMAVPRLHFGFEWFILEEIGVNFTAAAGPIDVSSGDLLDYQFDDLSAAQLSGVPPFQLGISAGWELQANLHLNSEIQCLLPQPPDYAAEPVPNYILSASLGGEYIFMLDGEDLQLAARLGVSGYNLFQGIWKKDAPVYEQFLFFGNAGVGLFFKGMSLNVSYAIAFWQTSIDLQNSRLAASFSFYF